MNIIESAKKGAAESSALGYIQAVENDTPTEVGVVDGLKPVLIGLAAKLSLKENRPVKIKEIEEQYGL